jgi:hypothetical protein
MCAVCRLPKARFHAEAGKRVQHKCVLGRTNVFFGGQTRFSGTNVFSRGQTRFSADKRDFRWTNAFVRGSGAFVRRTNAFSGRQTRLFAGQTCSSEGQTCFPADKRVCSQDKRDCSPDKRVFRPTNAFVRRTNAFVGRSNAFFSPRRPAEADRARERCARSSQPLRPTGSTPPPSRKSPRRGR